MAVTRYLQENKDEYDSWGPIHDFLRVDYTPKETSLILVDINVLFLIETKKKKKKYVEEMKRIQDDLHYPWMFAVSSEGRIGGLAMLWKDETNLHI